MRQNVWREDHPKDVRSNKSEGTIYQPHIPRSSISDGGTALFPTLVLRLTPPSEKTHELPISYIHFYFMSIRKSTIYSMGLPNLKFPVHEILDRHCGRKQEKRRNVTARQAQFCLVFQKQSLALVTIYLVQMNLDRSLTLAFSQVSD